MKKLVKVEEIEGEGLTALLGERVLIWCVRYFYLGILRGVNATDILLENAFVVYETGPLTDKKMKDMQALPGPWYIRTDAIESYGKVDLLT